MVPQSDVSPKGKLGGNTPKPDRSPPTMAKQVPMMPAGKPRFSSSSVVTFLHSSAAKQLLASFYNACETPEGLPLPAVRPELVDAHLEISVERPHLPGGSGKALGVEILQAL